MVGVFGGLIDEVGCVFVGIYEEDFFFVVEVYNGVFDVRGFWFEE